MGDDFTEDDARFLVDRAVDHIEGSLRRPRWTGRSSTALVAVAYGRDADILPLDADDLASCYRCLQRMPAHRRNLPEVAALLAKAESSLPVGAVAAARRAAGWTATPERTA